MTTYTYSFSGAQAIPDLTTINNVLAVSGTSGSITGMSVNLDLLHTYDNDLRISLIDPDGNSVLLSNRRGGSANNFTSTTFNDSASTLISAGSAPFTGSYRPDAALSTLYPGTVNGNWTLRIVDLAALDIGTLTAWSINITTVNSAPTLTSNATAISIAENTTAVATLTATDPDIATQYLTYSIVGGENQALFQISSGNQLRFISAPNFESLPAAGATPGYQITVQVSDGKGGTDTVAITVTVTDVNEFAVTTPSDINGTTNAIAENATGTVGITASSTDADGSNNTVTYSLVTSLAGTTPYSGSNLVIDGVTGVVSVVSAYDRETDGSTQTIFVKATSADGSSAVQAFTIAVTDVNEPVSTPIDSDAATNAVNENTTGTVGLTANAVDPDPTSNTVTYSLVADMTGTTAYTGGKLAIGSSTGVVTVTSAFDRETDGGTQTVYVKATSADGSSAVQAFTFAVSDVNEFAITTPADVDAATNTIAENATGTLGITASATDADATTNIVSYSLVTDLTGTTPYAGGKLAVGSSTGVVSVVSGFNRETDGATQTVYVKATSADGSSAVQAFTLTIDDVNEFTVTTPADVDASTNTIAENATGTIGITASATDADATTNLVSYSLVSDLTGTTPYTGGKLSINGSNGVVSVVAAFDREADGGSQTFYVKSTSADGSSAVQAFTFAVSDVNEFAVTTPVDANAAANVIDENATGAVGITASATDADATSTVTYALVTDLTGTTPYAGGNLAIGSSTGVVSVVSAFDRETDGASQTVYVKATSADGSSAVPAFTLTIDDVNEFTVTTPVDGNVAVDSIAENATGSVGLTVQSTDGDAGDTISYTLSGDLAGTTAYAGPFAIDETSGEVTLTSALDYETDGHTHTIFVKALSSDGSFAMQSFTIALTNVMGVITSPTPSALLEGTSEEDSITGGSGGSGLFGFAGNDTLVAGNASDSMVGGDDDDLMYGNGGNDILRGDGGNDTIYGGLGNDVLDGGAGIDVMFGGAGNDIYVVDDVSDVFSEDDGFGGDAGGVDTVMTTLDNYTLTDRFENLTLLGEDDMVGTGNALANRLTGNSGNNVLDGGSGADYLLGMAGDDLLIGGLGNDYIDGGTGADTMRGGADNDVYIVDSSDDVVDDSNGAGGDAGGRDTVRATASFTLSAYIEELTFYGSSNLAGTGNSLANSIYGNEGDNVLSGLDGNDSLSGGAGNDTLLGGAGDDRLDAGTGIDSLVGGAGNDYYIVADSADVIDESDGSGGDAGGADIVTSTASYTLSAYVERLILGGTGDLNGFGNNSANVINGNAGANLISGGDGNYSMFGGAGNDTLLGGVGADVLSGGAGTDSLAGGAGNDSYYVDDITNIVDETDGLGGDAGGVDTVFATVSVTLSAFVENLTLNGTGSTGGVGNALANAIQGNTNANMLVGGGGDDSLYGGGGNDTLEGGTGADRLSGGAGQDLFVITAASIGTGIDVITDFSAVDDTIELDAAAFSALQYDVSHVLLASNFVIGTAATTSNHHLIYNSQTGALLYDHDGAGGDAAVQFALFSTRPAITAADFVVV